MLAHGASPGKAPCRPDWPGNAATSRTVWWGGVNDAPTSGNDTREGKGVRVAAWLCLIVALAVGITLRNPAIALLGGLTIRVGLGVNPVKRGSRLSSISLQTAIVLLGFTLRFDRMVTVSAMRPPRWQRRSNSGGRCG